MIKRHFDGYIQNSVPLRTVNITQGKLRSDPWMVGKKSPIKEKKACAEKVLSGESSTIRQPYRKKDREQTGIKRHDSLNGPEGGKATFS